MDKAILLAVAASVCTATASLCQRKGAKDNETAGFDARLLVRLARQPTWLLGIAAMISGFIFQITALRYGDLALVQPILAAELLFVFGYLAVAGARRVTGRDMRHPAGGPARCTLQVAPDAAVRSRGEHGNRRAGPMTPRPRNRHIGHDAMQSGRGCR